MTSSEIPKLDEIMTDLLKMGAVMFGGAIRTFIADPDGYLSYIRNRDVDFLVLADRIKNDNDYIFKLRNLLKSKNITYDLYPVYVVGGVRLVFTYDSAELGIPCKIDISVLNKYKPELDFTANTICYGYPNALETSSIDSSMTYFSLIKYSIHSKIYRMKDLMSMIKQKITHPLFSESDNVNFRIKQRDRFIKMLQSGFIVTLCDAKQRKYIFKLIDEIESLGVENFVLIEKLFIVYYGNPEKITPEHRLLLTRLRDEAFRNGWSNQQASH